MMGDLLRTRDNLIKLQYQSFGEDLKVVTERLDKVNMQILRLAFRNKLVK